MGKRIGSSVVVIAVLVLALVWSGSAQRAARARQVDAVERKQTLVIGYPTTGIVISPNAPKYLGVIYVKVYPVTPALVTKYGKGPIATSELSASMRDVCLLPVGEYEVQYALRKGSTLTTFIHRNVMLRADRGISLTVEMNADARTTIIGGDMTAQEMANTIRTLQSEVAALKARVK